MVTTDRSDIAHRLQVLRWVGIDKTTWQRSEPLAPQAEADTRKAWVNGSFRPAHTHGALNKAGYIEAKNAWFPLRRPLDLPRSYQPARDAVAASHRRESPVRLALFTDSNIFYIDGAGRIIRELIRYVNGRVGHQLIVFHRGQGREKTEPLGDNAVLVSVVAPYLHVPGYEAYPLLYLVSPRRRLLARAGEFRPDVVLTVSPYLPLGIGRSALHVADKLGVPLVGSFDLHLMLVSQRYGRTARILVPSRLNLDTLVDVYARLKAEQGDVALVLVGDGPERDRIARRGIPDLVLTGPLYGAELSRAYASADLFAFPSHVDAGPMVIVEAMASGLPVVVSEQGGAKDPVVHGETGFVARDTEEFAAYVGRLVRDARLRAAMGTSARRRAEGQNWDHVFGQLMAALEEVRRDAGQRSAVQSRGSSG
jgi:glycosyltransferase involved in cell wall biosynthesis